MITAGIGRVLLFVEENPRCKQQQTAQKETTRFPEKNQEHKEQ